MTRTQNITLHGLASGTVQAFEEAKAAVARCDSIDEIKELRNRAEAFRLYSRQAHHGFLLQNLASEIKLRAERRGGEILRELGEAGVRAAGHGGNRRSSSTRKLEDLGVSKGQSHRWQRLARIPEGVFEAYIDRQKADENELTTKGALDLAKRLERQEHRQAVADAQYPTEEFADLEALAKRSPRAKSLLVDLPWPFDNDRTRAAARDHYPVMDWDRILALPVEGLLAPDAHVYLCAPASLLKEAFGVLDSWQLQYRTDLIWTKEKYGLGNYFRCAHEHVLLATRGSLPFLANDQRSWFQAPRTRHSEKPDELYRVIERCSPGPRIELFARKPREGWLTWGNDPALDHLPRARPTE